MTILAFCDTILAFDEDMEMITYFIDIWTNVEKRNDREGGWYN